MVSWLGLGLGLGVGLGVGSGFRFGFGFGFGFGLGGCVLATGAGTEDTARQRRVCEERVQPEHLVRVRGRVRVRARVRARLRARVRVRARVRDGPSTCLVYEITSPAAKNPLPCTVSSVACLGGLGLGLGLGLG